MHFGVWYVAANIVGGILGFFASFLLNKYVVFKKKDSFCKHLGRYFMVDMINLAVLTIILYLLVDYVGIDKGTAKFVAYAPVVLWNYFVYKFIVYV